MTRGAFPSHLFESIVSGEAKLHVSSARQEGPVVILTARIADCSPSMLTEPHSALPCHFCKAACVIHPETTRMIPDGMVVCHDCAQAQGYKPKEVIMHPLSVFEGIQAAARKGRP